jgi:MFS family permease
MTKKAEHRASLMVRLRGLPRPAWVICLGMFINKFGNFLSVFLILYLTAKGYSTFLAGMALGAVGAGSFLGNAIGGSVADRIGRRSTLVVSMLGSALFTVLVPLVSGNIYLTIALCVVIGGFAQLYRPAAGAILVDTVSDEARVTAFAVLRLAINLGMAVGPLVGGILSEYSYTYLFVGDALTSALFGLIVLVLLPETKPIPEEHEEIVSDRGYRDVFADRALVLYMLAMFAATYVYVQTTATLPLHVRAVHLSNSFYGLLLGINATACVFIELPLVRFTERRNPRHVMSVGLVLLGIGVGVIGLSDTRFLLILTVIVWSMAEMIYTPVATAYPGSLAPPHLRGRYQGAEGIAVTLAQTVGPAIGGFLFAVSEPAHWVACAVMAMLGAAVILVAKRKPTDAPPAATSPAVGMLTNVPEAEEMPMEAD